MGLRAEGRGRQRGGHGQASRGGSRHNKGCQGREKAPGPLLFFFKEFVPYRLDEESGSLYGFEMYNFFFGNLIVWIRDEMICVFGMFRFGV